MDITNLQSAAFACTAVAFSGFGEESSVGCCNYKTYTVFKKAMIDAIEGYDSTYLIRSYNDDGCNKCMKKMAIAIAFTTDKQPMTNEYLKELGFVPSGFFKKDKHPENKLCLWWIPTKQLIEVLEYEPSHKNIGKDK